MWTSLSLGRRVSHGLAALGLAALAFSPDVSLAQPQFGDNRYNAAAAYNAGPKQVALWTRMQAAQGNDYFLTAVNFDETKHYVRKVMNSYSKYGEIYGNEGPTGGLRAEP